MSDLSPPLTTETKDRLDKIEDERAAGQAKVAEKMQAPPPGATWADVDIRLERDGKTVERDATRWLTSVRAVHPDGTLEFQDGTARRGKGPLEVTTPGAEPVGVQYAWQDTKLEDAIYAAGDEWRAQQGLPKTPQTLIPAELQEFQKYAPLIPEMQAAGVVGPEIMSMQQPQGSTPMHGEWPATQPVVDPSKWRTTPQVKSWVWHRNNRQLNARYGTTDPAVWDYVEAAYGDLAVLGKDAGRAFAGGADSFFVGLSNLPRRLVGAAINFDTAMARAVWPKWLEDYAKGRRETYEEQGEDPLLGIYAKLQTMASGRLVPNEEYHRDAERRQAILQENEKVQEALRLVAKDDEPVFNTLRAISRGTGHAAHFLYGGPARVAGGIEQLFGRLGAGVLARQTATIAQRAGVRPEVVGQWAREGTLLGALPNRLAQEPALRAKMLQVMTKALPMGSKMVGMGGMTYAGGGDPAEAGLMAVLTPGFVMMSRLAHNYGKNFPDGLPRRAIEGAIEGTGFTVFDYHSYKDLIFAYRDGDWDGVKAAVDHLVGSAAGWAAVKTAGGIRLMDAWREQKPPSGDYARIRPVGESIIEAMEKTRLLLRETAEGVVRRGDERGETGPPEEKGEYKGPEKPAGDQPGLEDFVEKANLDALKAIDAKIAEIAPKTDRYARGDADVVGALYRMIGMPPPGGDDIVRIGMMRMAKSPGKALLGQEAEKRLTEALLKNETVARGVDPEGLLGPNSPLTKAGKENLVQKHRARAQEILTELNDLLSSLKTEDDAAAEFVGPEPKEPGAERVERRVETTPDQARDLLMEDLRIHYPEQQAFVDAAVGAGWQPGIPQAGVYHFNFGPTQFSLKPGDAGPVLTVGKKLARRLGWETAELAGDAAYEGLDTLTRAATLSSLRMRNKDIPPEAGWVRTENPNVMFHVDHGFYTEALGQGYRKDTAPGARWVKADQQPREREPGAAETPLTAVLSSILLQQHVQPQGPLGDPVRVHTMQELLRRLTNPESLSEQQRLMVEDPEFAQMLGQLPDAARATAIDAVARVVAGERDSITAMTDLGERLAQDAPPMPPNVDPAVAEGQLGEADQPRYQAMVGRMRGSPMDKEQLAEFEKLSPEDKARWLDTYEEKAKWGETEGKGRVVDPYGSARSAAFVKTRGKLPEKVDLETEEQAWKKHDEEFEERVREEEEWEPPAEEPAEGPPAAEPPSGGSGGAGAGGPPRGPRKGRGGEPPEDKPGGEEFSEAEADVLKRQGGWFRGFHNWLVGHTNEPVEEMVRRANEAMANSKEASAYATQRFVDQLKGTFGKSIDNPDLLAYMQRTGNPAFDKPGAPDRIQDVRYRLGTIKNGPALMHWIDEIGRPLLFGKFAELVASGQTGLESFRENYLTQLWEIEPDKGLIQQYPTRKLQQRTRFLQQRKISSYEEGIRLGLKPKTTNLADILGVYLRAHGETMAHRDWLRFMTTAELPTPGEMLTKKGKGLTLLMAPGKRAKAMGYRTVEHPALDYTFKGTDRIIRLKVHPGVAETVDRFLHTMKRGDIANFLIGLGGLMKQADLSMSGFHFAALIESAYFTMAKPKGGQSTTQTILDYFPGYHGVKSLVRGAEYVRDVAQAVGAIQHGLRLGRTKDIEHGAAYAVLDKVIDFGKSKDTDGWVKELVHNTAKMTVSPIARMVKEAKKINDVLLWDYVHQQLKLDAYMGVSEAMIVKAAVKKGMPAPATGKTEMSRDDIENRRITAIEAEQVLTEKEARDIRREAAKFVNDSFGGQNWSQYHRLSSGWLQGMGIGMLSIDWTLSNARVGMRSARALGVEPIRAAGAAITGKPYEPLAMSNPQDRAMALRSAAVMAVGVDLAQRAILTAALTDEEKERYLEAHGSFSIYDNSPGKKFGYVCIGYDSTGKEVHITVVKQVREVADYYDPDKGVIESLTGKMSPLVQMVKEQLWGTDSLGRTLPHKEAHTVADSWNERIFEMAAHFVPFSLRGSLDALTTGDMEKLKTFMFTWPRTAYSRWHLERRLESDLPSFLLNGDASRGYIQGLLNIGRSQKMKMSEAVSNAMREAREPFWDELKDAILTGDREEQKVAISDLARLGSNKESAKEILGTWYQGLRDRKQVMPESLTMEWVEAVAKEFDGVVLTENQEWFARMAKALKGEDAQIEKQREAESVKAR